MGFDGKTLIHPNQIEPCNAVFSPSPDEVTLARKMIAAFDMPENRFTGLDICGMKVGNGCTSSLPMWFWPISATVSGFRMRLPSSSPPFISARKKRR